MVRTDRQLASQAIISSGDQGWAAVPLLSLLELTCHPLRTMPFQVPNPYKPVSGSTPSTSSLGVHPFPGGRLIAPTFTSSPASTPVFPPPGLESAAAPAQTTQFDVSRDPRKRPRAVSHASSLSPTPSVAPDSPLGSILSVAHSRSVTPSEGRVIIKGKKMVSRDQNWTRLADDDSDSLECFD